MGCGQTQQLSPVLLSLHSQEWGPSWVCSKAQVTRAHVMVFWVQNHKGFCAWAVCPGHCTPSAGELPVQECPKAGYLCPSLPPIPAGPDQALHRTRVLASASTPYKAVRNSAADLQFRLIQQKMRCCSRLFLRLYCLLLARPSSAADSRDGLRSPGAVPRHSPAVWEVLRGLIW